MKSPSSFVNVFIHREPVDMRRGINGLCDLVELKKMGDLGGKNLFVFSGRRRNSIKPRRPRQIPPGVAGSNSSTYGGRDARYLRILISFGKASGGFFQAPTFSFEFEQVTVVHHAVEQRRNHDDVA